MNIVNYLIPSLLTQAPAKPALKLFVCCPLLIAALYANQTFARCNPGQVSVQILGSGGPELTDRRASSSYLVRVAGKAAVLIDTGPGSSLNFEKSGAQFADVKAVLFTHFHVDHSADFPMYIKSSFFSGRNTDLFVYGPQGNGLMPSTSEFIERLFGPKGVYRYLNEYVNKAKTSAYKIIAKNLTLKNHRIQRHKLSDHILLSAVPVHHGPIPALAWRIDAAGCAITFSGDMNNKLQTLATLAKNSDLLIVHNAAPETAQGAARNLHMPPSEIGKAAATANAGKLLLSHRMQRTLGREKETLQLIHRYFQGPVIFADDLDIIKPD